MADTSQLEIALINADKAGDTDAAKQLAHAIIIARTSDKYSTPSDPISGNSFGQNALIGIGRGMSNVGRGVSQFVGSGPTAEQVDEQRQLDQPLMKTAGGKIGNLAGTLAVTAPAMFVPGANTLVGSTVIGGALGAAEPVGTGESRLKNTAIGAASGGAGFGLAKGLSRLVSPQTSDQVKLLMKEGVTPTPGQILGGTAQRMEEGATSIPLLGDAIKSSKRSAVEEMNVAAINRSLKHIGESLPKGTVGNDAIEYASDKLGKAYGDLLPKLKVKLDNDLMDVISSIKTGTESFPQSTKDQFDRIVQNELINRAAPNGSMSGEAMKNIDSKLGSMVRGYKSSGDYDQRALGDALKDVQLSLRDSVERNNPDYANELSAINKGYANFLRVQNAAGKLGAKEGVFSPAQLRNAVRSLDASKGKSAFAKGKAPMQDLADAAENVLGPKVPDSGTPYRSAIGLGALGGGAVLNPYAAAGAAATTLPYLPILRSLTAKAMTSRPDVAPQVAGAIKKIAPALGMIAPAMVMQ